jgi:hypothetical protein
MPGALPASLLRLIRECIPTLQAAEVLLFFAAHPDRDFKAEEIVVAIRPTIVTVPAVKEYAALFETAGAITEKDGAMRYAAAAPELEAAIGQLEHAYNERPVTLIGAIYQIADGKIHTFSDAFKLRDPES